MDRDPKEPCGLEQRPPIPMGLAQPTPPGVPQTPSLHLVCVGIQRLAAGALGPALPAQSCAGV